MRVQSTCTARGESPSWIRHHDTGLSLAHGGTARSREEEEGEGGKGEKGEKGKEGERGESGREQEE